jgi:CO/xanthine dehydrogenase Mo-binding subunit
MDYLIPTASDMPRIETLICEDAPTPDNTLRAKGVGEAGCIGTAAAIANAIEDALGAAGSGTISSIPIMPALVRELAGAASPGRPAS